MRHVSHTAIVTAITSALCLAHTPLLANTSMGIKDLPDESRATVVKELARNKARAHKDGAEESESGRKAGKRDECNLAIDSDKSSGPGRRNTTTVITGSVIQMCGR